MGVADGDAAGDSDTVQDEAHVARNGEGQRGGDNTRKAVNFLPVWLHKSVLVPGFMSRCTAATPAGSVFCGRTTPFPVLPLPLLSETTGDQLDHRGHRFGFVRALSLQPDRRADARREQHHRDHAARARPPSIPYQANIAAELRGQLHDLRACTRMQSAAVG